MKCSLQLVCLQRTRKRNKSECSYGSFIAESLTLVVLRLAKSKVAISYTYEDSTISGPSRPTKSSKFAKHEEEVDDSSDDECGEGIWCVLS